MKNKFLNNAKNILEINYLRKPYLHLIIVLTYLFLLHIIILISSELFSSNIVYCERTLYDEMNNEPDDITINFDDGSYVTYCEDSMKVQYSTNAAEEVSKLTIAPAVGDNEIDPNHGKILTSNGQWIDPNDICEDSTNVSHSDFNDNLANSATDDSFSAEVITYVCNLDEALSNVPRPLRKEVLYDLIQKYDKTVWLPLSEEEFKDYDSYFSNTLRILATSHKSAHDEGETDFANLCADLAVFIIHDSYRSINHIVTQSNITRDTALYDNCFQIFKSLYYPKE